MADITTKFLPFSFCETCEELNHQYPEDRSNMSDVELVQFIDNCFYLYEKAGFSDIYWTKQSDLTHFNYHTFTVMRRLKTTDSHIETLPAWYIRMDSGETLVAYPEEICPIEMKANGYVPKIPQTASADKKDIKIMSEFLSMTQRLLCLFQEEGFLPKTCTLSEMQKLLEAIAVELFPNEKIGISYIIVFVDAVYSNHDYTAFHTTTLRNIVETAIGQYHYAQTLKR